MSIICKLNPNDRIISLLDEKKISVVSEKFVDPYDFLDINDILNIKASVYFNFLIGAINFIRERYNYIKFEDYKNEVKNIGTQNIQLNMYYPDYARIYNDKKKEKIKDLAMGLAKVLGLFSQIVKKNVSIVFRLNKYATKKISHIKYIYDDTSIVDCDISTENCEILNFKDISLDDLTSKIDENLNIVSGRDGIYNYKKNFLNSNDNHHSMSSGVSGSKDLGKNKSYNNNLPNQYNKNIISNLYNRNGYNHWRNYYRNYNKRKWYGPYYKNNKYSNFNHNNIKNIAVEYDYDNKSASNQQEENKKNNKKEDDNKEYHQEDNEAQGHYEPRPDDEEYEL